MSGEPKAMKSATNWWDNYSHSTSIRATHPNNSHSMTGLPWRLTVGVMEIVNSSTGAEATAVTFFAEPRYCELVYSVPHSPFC